MERGIPSACLQEIIKSKDDQAALRRCNEHNYVESWHILDGCLIIYDANDPPDWLKLVFGMLGQSSH